MCVEMTSSLEVLVCLSLKGRTGTSTICLRDGLEEEGVTSFLQLGIGTEVLNFFLQK